MINTVVLIFAFSGLLATIYYAYIEYNFDGDYEALKSIKKNDLLNSKNINDFFVKDVVKLIERLDKNSKKLIRRDPSLHLFHSQLKEVISNRSKNEMD
jgi:hypothetical protein